MPSNCQHKVTVRPWRIDASMVRMRCERCGDDVFVSLPSPPPGEGHKKDQGRFR